MKIVVVGINFKSAPIKIQEKFCFSFLERELFLSELKNHALIQEGVLLSTCNRTELYACLSDLQKEEDLIPFLFKIKKISFSPEWAKHFFYIHSEERAVRHLLRVSTALDALVIGEKQILGQVKEATELARQKNIMGRTFNILFQIAVRAGKKAQNETNISIGGSSVSWAAIAAIRKVMHSLDGKSILIIGSGKMAELAATHLKDRGINSIYVMNRTMDRASDLAKSIQGKVVPFCDIKEVIQTVDICFCCIGSPHYILEKQALENVIGRRDNRPLFIADISVPRTIDPEISTLPEVFLVGNEELQAVVKENMWKRKEAVSQIEVIIEDKMQQFYSKTAPFRLPQKMVS